MLVKDRKRHHEELIRELEDVILEEKYIEKDKSPYLIDYLYGYSDIDKEVNEFLDEMKLNEKWVVFYRCLLNLEFINGKYDKYRNIGENIFLIRNENDFEKWKKAIKCSENGDIKAEVGKKINLILDKTLEHVKNKDKKNLTKIDELFLCLETKDEFIKLLEIIVLKKEKEEDEYYEKCIYETGKLLREAHKSKKILFTKTDFFTNILGINKSKISKIQDKYGEVEKKWKY